MAEEKKQKPKKDLVLTTLKTRKNKERIAKTQKSQLAKLQRKQERRMTKLSELLAKKGVKWETIEGRLPRLEIKYMERRLKKLKKA